MSGAKQSFRKRWSGWMKGLHRFVDRPWYDWVVALLAGLDFFLFVIPIDPLLFTRMLLRRDGWLKASWIMALGSAIGALALATFVQWDVTVVERTLSHVIDLHSPEAQRAALFIQEYGALGVGMITLTFIPPQIVVFAGALEGVPVMSIFLFALLGRGIKYSAYAAICVYFPQVIKKYLHKDLPGIGVDLSEKENKSSMP